jgi:hypothetical protein
MGDQRGDEEGEVPVAALLDALDLPRAAVARWMDHLDAFFARHGGARRYAALSRLTAETRAACAQPRSTDGEIP